VLLYNHIRQTVKLNPIKEKFTKNVIFPPRSMMVLYLANRIDRTNLSMTAAKWATVRRTGLETYEIRLLFKQLII
jgi:hypothetical protein